MKIHHRRDVFAGLMFIAVAAFFGYFAQDYPMGVSNRMGPGYFPTLLSGILGVLGTVILASAFRSGAKGAPPQAIPPTHWRGLGCVLVAVAFFALALPQLGFVISVAGMTGLAALASKESSLVETLCLIIGLVVLGVGVFGWGLELQFPILPIWLTE